jgi:hypothetical protein
VEGSSHESDIRYYPSIWPEWLRKAIKIAVRRANVPTEI